MRLEVVGLNWEKREGSLRVRIYDLVGWAFFGRGRGCVVVG